MAVVSTSNMKQSEVVIYFLAAPQDQQVCEAIHRHLTPIVRTSPVPITVLDDFDIPAGTDVAQHKAALLDADIVLSLISSNFIADDDIYNRNQAVIERYNRGETLMISVLAKNCMWKTLPLAQLPLLPHNHRPLDSWPNEDEGFTSVVTELYDRITGMLTATEGAAPPPAAPSPDPVVQVSLTDVAGSTLVGVATGAGDGPPSPGDMRSAALEPDELTAAASASATDTHTDMDVVIELPVEAVAQPVAEPVAEVAAATETALGPPPAAQAPVASFALNQPADRVQIQADWRRKYYRRVTGKRLLALAIDYAFAYAFAFLVPAFIYGVFFWTEDTSIAEEDQAYAALLVLGLVIFYLLAPAFEASKWRATPGKHILKLQVTTEGGERISYVRAFIRNVMRSLTLYSYLFVVPLVIQYFRFKKTKQLFHDEVSSTTIGERLDES